jgi:glycosyltransferase involved in cell wall biosynthesis
MKIMHIITRLNKGGTERWIKDLSESLESKSSQTYLVYGVTDENEIESLEFKRFKTFKLRTLRKSPNPFNDIRTIVQLIKLIYTVKPDIVNTHTSKSGLLGRIATAPFSLFNGTKLIHTYHGHLLYGYFNKVIVFTIVFIERILSYITHGFIVSGIQVASELKNKKIIKQNMKLLIVNPPLQEFKLVSNNVRNFYKFDEQEILVAWMGRFEKVKRPDRVIELAKLFPEIKFVMAGSGALLNQIKEIAPSNVYFTGWVEPSFIWSGSDIALLTSANEAIPFVLLEASSYKIPSVAEDVGSVRDIITDKYNGFLTHSHAERCKALDLLVHSKETRKTMGENAYVSANENFSKEKFVNDHLLFYTKMLNHRRSDEQ